jgi:hypothetical protein
LDQVQSFSVFTLADKLLELDLNGSVVQHFCVFEP